MSSINIAKYNTLHLFITGTFFIKLVESTVSFIPPVYKFYLPISVLLGFVFSYKYIKNIKGFFSLFLVLLTFFSYLIVLSNVIISNSFDINGTSAFDFHLVLLVSVPAFFLYGISVSKTLSSHNTVSLFDKFAIILIAFIIFTNINFQYFRLDFESFKYDKAVYLFLGDILAIIGLYYFSISSNNFQRLLYFSFFVTFLFIVYSRTSLYFFIFTVFCYLFVQASGKKKTLYLLSIAFIFTFFMYISEVLRNVDLPYSINRMLFVFSGSEDGSLSGRKIIFNESLNSLTNSILLGDFGNQIEIFGAWSFYIHNILSYLRQFGILIFLSVLIMMIFPLSFFAYKVYDNKHSVTKSVYIFGFMVSLYFLCIYLFSRSYLYAYIFFIPGFYIGVVCSEKRLRSTNW